MRDNSLSNAKSEYNFVFADDSVLYVSYIHKKTFLSISFVGF